MKADPIENDVASRTYTRANGLFIMALLVLAGFSMVLLYDYMSDRADQDLQEKVDAAPKTIEGRVETWLLFGHPQINESLKALRVSDTQNWIVSYLVQLEDGDPEVWGIDLDTLGTDYLRQNGTTIEIRLPGETLIARSRLYGRNAELIPVYTEDAARPGLNVKARELVEWKLEKLIERLERDISGVEVELLLRRGGGVTDERVIEVEAEGVERSQAVTDTRPAPVADARQEGCVGTFLAAMSVIVGALYIINPGAGVIEFIPDNVPFIGNLDEAGFTALMIFGLQSLGRRFRKKK